MDKHLLSIIIVTWNSIDTIKACLDSVYRQQDIETEIVLVDNGSTDGTRELITTKYPGVKTVFNTENVGYAKANNQGIKVAKGDCIVLLNADAVLHDGCLHHFFKAMHEHPDVGSVSGKILKMNGTKDIIDSTGIVLNRKKFSPADRGEGQVDKGQFDEREHIFGASGAAACYSRSMLDHISVNGEIFDEDFFAYYEDVDLAWRAQLYGWKCLYVPEAIVYHLRRGPKNQNRMVYVHAFKNRYLCYIKNETALNFLHCVPYNIGYEMLRCMKRFLLEPQLLRSIYLTLQSLPRMLKKRSVIQKNKRVSTEYLKQFN